jgi:hypothetical protein
MNTEKSTMGERMANVEIVHSNRSFGPEPNGSKASKWMEKALRGEITEAEARRRDEEELMQELGLD